MAGLRHGSGRPIGAQGNVLWSYSYPPDSEFTCIAVLRDKQVEVGCAETFAVVQERNVTYSRDVRHLQEGSRTPQGETKRTYNNMMT